MASDLKSIGTYGWFPSSNYPSPVLRTIGTYGWFLGDGTFTPPEPPVIQFMGEIIPICLNRKSMVVLEFEL